MSGLSKIADGSTFAFVKMNLAVEYFIVEYNVRKILDILNI